MNTSTAINNSNFLTCPHKLSIKLIAVCEEVECEI